jgi:multiple sugar transport system ATP-binding protein
VFVTHDQNEAMALADHIVVMNEGEILQADDPDGIYNRPSCMFVARFIGRPPMNFLPLAREVAGGDTSARIGDVEIDVPRVEAASPRAVLGVRPEHVLLGGEGPLAATVTHVEYFGSHWIAELESGAGALKAVVPKTQRPQPGEHVRLSLRAERIVLFDAATTRLMPSASTLQHRPAMHHG